MCSKEPSRWDGSFESPKYIFWLRNKKIIFIYVLLSRGLIQCFECYSLWKCFVVISRIEDPDYPVFQHTADHGPSIPWIHSSMDLIVWFILYASYPAQDRACRFMKSRLFPNNMDTLPPFSWSIHYMFSIANMLIQRTYLPTVKQLNTPLFIQFCLLSRGW